MLKNMYGKEFGQRMLVLAAVSLLVCTILLAGMPREYDTSAQAEGEAIIPRNIRITDLGPTGFKVSWVTDEPTLGEVKYGDSPEGYSAHTAMDERLDNEDYTAYAGTVSYMHSCRISGLMPNETCYFKLVSDGVEYPAGEPRAQQTKEQSPIPPSGIHTIYMYVDDSLGLPVLECIAYIKMTSSAGDTEWLSKPVALETQNNRGAVSINLANAVYPNGTAYIAEEGDAVDIVLSSAFLGNATLSKTVGSTSPQNLGSHVFDLPFTLSNAVVNPLNGDTEDDFTFQVEYEGDVLPDHVFLWLDDQKYEMEETDASDTDPADGKEYHYSTELAVGIINWHYQVKYGGLDVNTNTLPNLSGSVDVEKADSNGDDDEIDPMLIAALVIIIAVVVILMFILLSKR